MSSSLPYSLFLALSLQALGLDVDEVHAAEEADPCNPASCEAFLSCQSPSGRMLIIVYILALVGLTIGSFIFLRMQASPDELAAQRPSQLTAGCKVRLQGLTDQANNGKMALYVGSLSRGEDGRCLVEIDGMEVRIKKENVELVEGPKLQKRLTFHSTDDSPHEFVQTGYKFSPIGAFLLYSWVGLFALGYIYTVVASILVYAPSGILWWKPMPLFFVDFFHGDCAGGGSRNWPSYMGPYCILFTGTHILWLGLSLTWETMKVSFMSPAGTLGQGATHVLIEEEVAEINDKDLRDGDASSLVVRIENGFRRLTAGFNSSATRTVVKIDIDRNGSRSIEYTCVRYAFERTAQGERFRPKGIIDYTPMELHGKYDNGGMTSSEAANMMKECGKNEIAVYVPGVLEALVSEFADFTYAFNSIGTWSYLVYSAWNIGIFWLLMTICSGSYRSLGIIRPNQQSIAELAKLKGKSSVMRDGEWKSVDISDIVLGDVIQVEGNDSPLPCDGIVIAGSLVVNESMLTGEPMPIQKMPVDKSASATVGKKNEAYSGTKCMQSVGPSNGKAVLVATSVGALTTRGQLVRMVLFPTSVRFRYNDQMPIVYALILIYMLGLCAIYLSPIVDLGDWIAKYMMLLNTIAMCLSPMLPVSLVMGQAVAATRLKNDHQIQCLQPARIPIAGKISHIVFDKTGTITKDGMDFDSVIPVNDSGALGEAIKMDSENPKANPEKIEREVPKKLQYALAACNTVTTLPPTKEKPEGILVGNAVECAMVEAAGWKIFADENKVVSPDGKETIPIAKRLDFDHHRMTSGVVVQTGEELIVYIKGSYEKVQSISKPEAVPGNYGTVTEQCAKDGYYVLGIATKTMPLSEKDKLVDMTRDQIEDGLSVCGLLLFRNEMKRDSPQAIEELKAGGIRSVICTGDNALTGMSIGRKCGIVTSSEVLLGEIGEQKGKIEWRDPDKEGVVNVDIHAAEFADRNLAVTQAAWRHLHRNVDKLDEIWTRLTVFARMKPEDKINVVKYFQGRGLIVGMAGDGGNDCGGLRAAHAGLALSDAEASMVSPFSTGRDGGDGITLMAMVDVIREGRACLATNMGTFTYFMVYCFTLTTIRTVLTVVSAINFGEFVWFFMDVAVNIVLVGFMVTSGPTEKLGKFRPTATLLGPRTLAGIVYPYVSCMVFYVIAIEAFLKGRDFYDITGGSFHPINDIGLSSAAWMLRGDNYVSPVAMGFLFMTLITTAYVNTYGGEFRHSILQNKGMQLMHGFCFLLFFGLLWTDASRLNCVFRVNCDTTASIKSGGLDAEHILVMSNVTTADGSLTNGFWSGLAFWSAGGLGNCFMGPQIKTWQEEDIKGWLKRAAGDNFEKVTEFHYEGDFQNPVTASLKLTCDGSVDANGKPSEEGCAVSSQWTPDAATPNWNDEPCRPYFMEKIGTEGMGKWTNYEIGAAKQPLNPDLAGPLEFTKWDANEISTGGSCEGPNNCYPFDFKVTLTVLLLVHTIGHHLYVKFVMHGSIVDRFRKQQQQVVEEVELQAPAPLGSALLMDVPVSDALL